MSAAALVERVNGLRCTGPNRWIARCPAHEDRQPSLAIRKLDDGRVLVHCFSGCSVGDVLASVGLRFDALFPPSKLADRVPPERRAFSATDILRALANEALIVACAASSLAQGMPLSATDRDRVTLAAGRFQAAITETGNA